MATSFRDELKQTFRSGDTLNALLLTNLIVFLLILIPDSFLKLFKVGGLDSITVNFFAVPALPSQLIVKPWTLITYQFLHLGFFHILFNLFWLFWMGKIFAEYLGMKKLLSTYIIGGIAGGILFIIGYNVFPLFKDHPPLPLLGASASVMAITFAIAVYIPNYIVNIVLIGPVRLKYIALVCIALDLIKMSSEDNPLGHISHLGGAIYGYIFAMNMKEGRNIAGWFDRLADRIKNLFSRRKMKVIKKERPLTDEEYLHNKKAGQEKIDAILDKISRSGYGSLTSEEREILFNYSNKK